MADENYFIEYKKGVQCSIESPLQRDQIRRASSQYSFKNTHLPERNANALGWYVLYFTKSTEEGDRVEIETIGNECPSRQDASSPCSSCC